MNLKIHYQDTAIGIASLFIIIYIINIIKYNMYDIYLFILLILFM